MPSFGQFKFRMTEAIIGQIVDHLAELDWAPLVQAEVDRQIPADERNAVGVYILGQHHHAEEAAAGAPAVAIQRLSNGTLVRVIYVGQSQSAIYTRLSKHARFVRDRCGLANGGVMFKGAEIVIFDSVGVESRLIELFGTNWRDEKQFPGWNFSGFGSNDSGGGRDSQDASEFDLRWPIDINVVKDEVFVPKRRAPNFTETTRKAISALSKAVPYTVRPHKADKKHPELDRIATFENVPLTAYEAVRKILAALPQGWIARVYPVKIVFHRETSQGPVANPMAWPPDFRTHHYYVIKAL